MVYYGMLRYKILEKCSNYLEFLKYDLNQMFFFTRLIFVSSLDEIGL